MRSLTKKTAIALTALAAMILLSAESCDEGAGQVAENETRQSNYDRLTKQQPAKTMGYSPTRETKNFWIETWDEPGKLSYVYLLNTTGDTIGYYILEGLPVSYCTSLIPPYQVDSTSNGKVVKPAPSIDGTFSSSSNCGVFYGKDATTGSYIEYTTGQGINALLYDQPLPRFKDAKPLGRTTTEDVK